MRFSRIVFVGGLGEEIDHRIWGSTLVSEYL